MEFVPNNNLHPTNLNPQVPVMTNIAKDIGSKATLSCSIN
jgi:hypothetical protein